MQLKTIFGILLILFGLMNITGHFMVGNPHPQIKHEYVDCYDYRGNVIVGAVCVRDVFVNDSDAILSSLSVFSWYLAFACILVGITLIVKKDKKRNRSDGRRK